MRGIAAFVACFAALGGAAEFAPLPEHVPHGSYPVRLTLQTNTDEPTLRLTGTVPNVDYLVMVWSNKPHAQWLPFAHVIGITNREPVADQFGTLKIQRIRGSPRHHLHATWSRPIRGGGMIHNATSCCFPRIHILAS